MKHMPRKQHNTVTETHCMVPTIPTRQTLPPLFAAASAVATLDSKPQQSTHASGIRPPSPTTLLAASSGDSPFTFTVKSAPSFSYCFVWGGGSDGVGRKRPNGGPEEIVIKK